ncbi:hypothetical protein FVEN_g9994 [Fusarium venenatum]|uniref:Nephrocystin 3-like N-terminal domain-containing protein n=1 Tax=Fusarium venenatum TaxID=56646 RepID=A0A2L2T8I0_9HYPO|nr:uncharacterized protein FVRRES_04953 [Fusarium venenatum]KAG8351984.1 hypothetical protein FVEN_g9994 [Fusarium venenatum]CEI60517.1 unnamed protein product [Fusarium venenatum]
MSFAQPTKKSFSSTVDFSDQSYEMPYFVDVDAPAMKASGVTRKPIASQPEASTPRSIAPTYELKDPKRKTTQENVDPATPKGAEHGPPLPPRTHSFKPNPAAFLQSFKFPSIQHFKIEPRATDSSAWLDKDPLFSNWKSSKHTLLWLRGSEGCGKSTLMNHALHTQLQMEPSAMHLTCSFSICGSEIPRTRLGLLKSILHQLIPQAPEAFDDIKTRFQRIQDALPSKQQVAWSAQELFEDLTKTIAKILKTRSVCMYVDGIDRSEGETAAKFVQDFSKLLERSQPKPSTKEPTVTHGLKIIFSSTIFPAKEPFPQSYINVDEKNGPSLRQFLKEQLSTTDSNTRQLILSKSGSSFISARLIIQHVKLFGPMQSSLVQQPSPTPAPISFLLGGYFQNMAQQGNKSLASLLSWVCLTTRPLTLAELRVALSLDMIHKLESFKYLLQAEPFSRYSSDESFQSWIKATSWGLLETVTLRGQKVVKVMHDSISSFFLSKGLAILSYGSQPPESPNSPLQISHKSLATNLLRYLVVLTKEPKLPNGDDKDPTFELLGYAGANWSNHISAAGLVKPDASKILKLLQWPSDSVMNVLVKWDQENHAVSELKGTLWAHIFAVYGHASLLSVAIKKVGNEALGLSDNQKRTPLHHAALHGHLAASKQLLKSGAKGDARAANGQTALHYAVLQGHQSVMKPLIDNDAGLVSATNHLAQTPLLLAVIRGTSSAVKLLLERRADVKALDRFKSSALHHAVGTDKSSLLKLLLDSGAEMNLQNAQGHTPLHLAISENRPAIIKLLLERGCRVDIPDMSGRTPLHMTAASGNKSCAQELLKRKVTIDTKDRDGQTALVYAVEGLHVSLVKVLLGHKSDVNARNKQGFNILMLAVRVNQEKIAKLLLDADPDLDVLSSEGHTVIFYAVYRGKAVSLLSEKEQLVASLLLKHYKKKQVVWNAEWIACKEKFMAEHGKKKGDAKLKTKSKAGSKKTAAPPSAPIPHKKQVRKPVDAKLEDVSKASTDSKMPAPKPNTPVAGSKESVRPNPKPTTKPNPKAVPKVDHKADPRPDSKAHQNPDPKVSYKVDHKPDTKPGSTATSQSHTAANAYSPFNSSGPVISPPLPQRPAAAQNNSISMPTQTHQKQQNSAFMPFQPPQSTVGTSVHTSFNTGSASPTGHQRLPTNHRSSWDMYTALSASSPESAQTTPIVTKNPYTSYSGASQQPPRGDSFRPFQPFQSNVSPGSPSNATPQSRGQSNDRYSLPSQSSYAQGQNSSGKQATQQGTVQGYQPFSINPQTPSMVPSHPQATGRKPVNSSINPITSLSIGRKPVGGQPVTGAPRKSSPPNQMQASQSLVGIVQTTHGKSQAQSGAVSPLPITPQEAPGKQSITPVASQSSIAAQNSALGHSAIASARPALAVAQKPVAQAATSSKPITIQQPTSAQKPAQVQAVSSQKPSATPTAPKPSTQQQPAAIQKSATTQPSSQRPSIAAKPSISQQPTVAQKPVPVQRPTQGQAASSQKPSTVTTAPKPSTQQQPTSQKSTTSQQPPPAQKPAPPQKHAAGPTAAKPSTLQQPTMTQRPSPPQKSTSFQQSGSITRPSPAQKPAPTQQATPNEKKLAPSGPATAPGKPALVQNSCSPVHKKPAPPSAYPSGYSSQTQSTSGQRSIETYTESQDTKYSGSGNSSGRKVAAAAGAGVLAGAAGGYFLSNYVQEHHHYESNSINDESFRSDDVQYQPVPPASYTENYYLDTQGEPSEHSEEYSEAEESEDGGKSDDESEDNDSISFSVEASDADDSDDQVLSDDDDLDLDEVDSDEDEIEDDVQSLDFDQDESDSPDVATDFTDDDNAGDISDIDNDDDDDDEDASDEETGLGDMQAESDSGLDTDPGQDDSDSDGDAGQDVDSNEDIGNEPEHLQAHYQQQMVDQSDSENEAHPEQYGHFQHQAVDETDSEDEVQQSYFQQPYQQQVFQQQEYDEEEPDYHKDNQQQNHFQQQTFQQPDSDDEEQPVQYVNHQQQVVYQSDSEDEDEMQQNHYYGQHQHQAQSTFDEDSDDQVDVDSDNEVDEQTGNNEGGNGYGQQNHGVYEGAGYDSDY